MKWTGLNELRESYLSFFESKGHLRLPSFSLVPQDDKGLLLINSGMAPMKKYFTGQVVPPRTRVTTCQKCIRTPDIESVGKTSRHGTYFEMLGNFSFGDYFKKDAITWAWEFLTKVVEIPQEKLYATIYPKDEEAFQYWVEVGMDPAHIVRLEDNFWEIGSGPCGPDSEIFYDRGEKYGCGSPNCGPGCDCDRYIEIWNNVFTQFNSDGEGNYTPLEHPNIDTGMGLERLACIMQDVDNLFEVDTVQNIMKHIARIAGVEYKKDERTDISLRVITDHIRSTTFMIGDGVVPQNEGRGYVLKRLLRRAARHGRLLGITEPFLYKVCETVIQENASAYPELTQKKDYITKIIKVEEERFAKTVDQGIETLTRLVQRLDDAAFTGKRLLSGEEAFRLYDTYGFPIDLTREILSEHNIPVDEEAFARLMNQQRQNSRNSRAELGNAGWTEDVMAALKEETNTFTGYGSTSGSSEVMAIVRDGAFTETLTDGDIATVILKETPFYAESGGQVGDTGVIRCGESEFRVEDCKKSNTGLFMHIGQMTSGVLSKGDQVEAQVDEHRRAAIMRNHTACHLLQAALRTVLGDHVHQAGSMVSEDRCRFDFSHFSAMTAQELAQVELLVNQMILSAIDVTVDELPIEEAKKLGAMALFGEKYGDIVRVCKVADKSVEFCGGTHVRNTSWIGLFKIVSESSVAAGVRRIEAVTGEGVLGLLVHLDSQLRRAAENLKLGNPEELVPKTTAITAELKAKDREIAELNGKIASMQAQNMFQNARQIGKVRFISAAMTDVKPEALRTMGDNIKSTQADMVAVLVGVSGSKASILAVCGAEAVKAGVHAGKLVKQLCALAGGSGGGRPDSAMGGASEIFKIDEAVAQAEGMILEMQK